MLLAAFENDASTPELSTEPPLPLREPDQPRTDREPLGEPDPEPSPDLPLDEPDRRPPPGTDPADPTFTRQ